MLQQSCPHHVCVMKTILGIDTSEDGKKLSSFITSPIVQEALRKEWFGLVRHKARMGAGVPEVDYAQNVKDPHAVSSDPATTSLVSMSLLRNDNTLMKGKYAENLKKGMEFLLKAVENCPANQVVIQHLPIHNHKLSLEKMLM